MIVRNLKSLARTDRHVKSHSSKSTRFLLADDGMGYSLNLTEIEAGLEIEMRYDHHFETVHCISGTGSIEDMATSEVHHIGPGTLYALDKHDHHILRSKTRLELICVFNPALKGTEIREPRGGYPPP